MSGKLKASERGLEILIKRAEAGKSAGIVVQWQDRLTRGRAWPKQLRSGRRLDRLLALASWLWTMVWIPPTKAAELFFTIHAALAREQWKVYAKRWRLAKKNAVELGLFTANITPVGYLRVEQATRA